MKIQKSEIKNDKKLALVVIWTMIFLSVLTILMIVDNQWYNARYFNNLYYREQCDYVVPKGWKIVSNGKMFAVKCEIMQGEYLHESMNGIRTMYVNIAEPALFFSKCKAKAYLKAYLKDQEPNFNEKEFK